MGKGSVCLIASQHYLGGAEGKTWLPCVTDFLEGWVHPVWPLEVRTESGHGTPQTMLNRVQDGWLVTLGNHWSEPWRGEVKLAVNRAQSRVVLDVWAQVPLASQRSQGDQVRFKVNVPPYSLRTYRVQ